MAQGRYGGAHLGDPLGVQVGDRDALDARDPGEHLAHRVDDAGGSDVARR